VDASEFTEYRPLMFSITTRLAIDHLRSARVRRESYVGDLAARAARGGRDIRCWRRT
jgi:DNA-directed RNA polymerase specialized sigma24 family protein